MYAFLMCRGIRDAGSKMGCLWPGRRDSPGDGENMGSPSEMLKHHAEREVAVRMFQSGETVEYVQRYVHLDVEEIEEIKRSVDSRTIDDFNQTNRNILEQGINLLRYGFNADEIKGFLKAAADDPELADFIIGHMSVWGPGLGYE